MNGNWITRNERWLSIPTLASLCSVWVFNCMHWIMNVYLSMCFFTFITLKYNKNVKEDLPTKEPAITMVLYCLRLCVSKNPAKRKIRLVYFVDVLQNETMLTNLKSSFLKTVFQKYALIFLFLQKLKANVDQLVLKFSRQHAN